MIDAGRKSWFEASCSPNFQEVHIAGLDFWRMIEPKLRVSDCETCFPKSPSTHTIRTLGFYMVNVFMAWAKYSYDATQTLGSLSTHLHM